MLSLSGTVHLPTVVNVISAAMSHSDRTKTWHGKASNDS